MKHVTTKSFWKCFEELPEDIRGLAEQNYELLKCARSRYISFRNPATCTFCGNRF